ncbi:MAG TPA: tripartite tricarboxylate transporter TctB family protein [Thermodesulfobacteriota bacterium]
MRKADLVTAIVLLILAAVVVWDSYELGIGWGPGGPGSGFFPFWMGLIMIGCCLGIIGQARRRPDGKPFIPRKGIAPVLKVLVPAVGFVVLMQFVGLYVSAAVYLAVYMRWIGRHSWSTVAGVALGFAVIAFFVFETWFLVPMPKGPVESWLGY